MNLLYEIDVILSYKTRITKKFEGDTTSDAAMET
jgi:hypothetical protein